MSEGNPRRFQTHNKAAISNVYIIIFESARSGTATTMSPQSIDFTGFRLDGDSSRHRRGRLAALSTALHLLEHENDRRARPPSSRCPVLWVLLTVAPLSFSLSLSLAPEDRLKRFFAALRSEFGAPAPPPPRASLRDRRSWSERKRERNE